MHILPFLKVSNLKVTINNEYWEKQMQWWICVIFKEVLCNWFSHVCTCIDYSFLDYCDQIKQSFWETDFSNNQTTLLFALFDDKGILSSSTSIFKSFQFDLETTHFTSSLRMSGHGNQASYILVFNSSSYLTHKCLSQSNKNIKHRAKNISINHFIDTQTCYCY